MRCRLVAFLSVLIASCWFAASGLAERPSLQRKLVADAGFGGSHASTTVEHGVARNVTRRKRTCPQEAALRAVLLDLGLKEAELADIRNVEGVEWHKCNVQWLHFNGRKDLSGTLSKNFKKLKDLRSLNLGNTKISGDLAVLANCTQMIELSLRNTLVTGNLAALAEARMRFLDLSNSKVTGNLGALNGAELNDLHLSNTRIAGDVAVLGTWPYIREVDLSDTAVTGNFDEDSEFKKLEVLKLTRTKIDFLEGFLREDFWWGECPFPEVTTLEVSGLAMDAWVSEFLSLFSYCQHLSSIGAAGCGLTGEIPKTISVFGEEFPFSATALGRVLVLLDLASNSIDRVASIPNRLKTLVLAGNTNMSFAEGVLQQAVRDGILLDVQNVTFTNQTDAHRCMV